MTRGTLHFPLLSFAAKQGGLANAVIQRANVLATSGEFEGIWIEVLGWQGDLAGRVNRRRKSGQLHPAVQVRSLLHTLDLTTGSRGVRVTDSWDEARLAEVADGFTRDKAGRVRTVTHTMPDGSVRRDEFDAQGRLIRSLDLQPDTDLVVAQHWIGVGGKPFLSIEQDAAARTWTGAETVGPRPTRFATSEDLYRHAFDSALAGEAMPIVFSEFRDKVTILPGSGVDDVVARLEHPNFRNVAVLHSNHHSAPFGQGSPVNSRWRKLLDANDTWDATVAWTQQQRADIQGEFGPDTRIDVVTPGIMANGEPAETYDDRRILFVSRIHAKKRVDEAVRVLAKVVARIPDAHLDFYGFGYGNDLEREVRALIEDLGVEQHWRFMGFTDNPREMYQDSCVTILTSDSEGFGQILLESMSVGVPVIAFDSPYGPSEVILDGKNGYLVERGDHDTFAERLCDVLESSELRGQLSRGAHRTLEDFTPEAFEAQWLAVLERVVRQRVGRRPLGSPPLLRSARIADNQLEMVVDAGADWADATAVLHHDDGTELSRAALVSGRATLDFAKVAQDIPVAISMAKDQPEARQRVRFAAADITSPRSIDVSADGDGNLTIRRRAPMWNRLRNRTSPR